MLMEISELFYSIQGEGKRSGRPSFFIRTNFCNLRCRFSSGNLCDTPYTSWQPEDPQNIGKLHIDEIVRRYSLHMCDDIVITGGEPAIQTEELLKLCTSLKEVNGNSHITLETNGTISGEFSAHIDLASISPKLMSSVPAGTGHEKMHRSNMKNTGSLRKYSMLHKEGKIDVQWKFVYSGAEDLSEISDYALEFGIAPQDIYLMPEGISAKELERNREEVVNACLKSGYNYTDRLHILIWGSKRGV